MGIASLIIGIAALVIGFVPMCGVIAAVPAIVGLILGIVEIKKKGKTEQPTGMGKAGTALNAVALVVILVWTLVFAAAAKKMEDPEFLQQLEQQVEQGMQNAMKEAEKASEAADDAE